MLKIYSHYTDEKASKKISTILQNINSVTAPNLILENIKNGGKKLNIDSDGSYYMLGHTGDPEYAITVFQNGGKPQLRYGSKVNAFIIQRLDRFVQVVEIKSQGGVHHHKVFGDDKLLTIVGNEVKQNVELAHSR